MSSTWPKKIRTKLDHFAINVQKWWGKIFGQKFFLHKLVHLTSRKQYWQADRQISVEMTRKSRSMPNDEKKELFRKKILGKVSPWIRGKRDWQSFRLFFDEKNRFFFPFNFHKSLKKQAKTLLKQRYVLKMILWSGRKQFCHFDRENFEKNWTIFAECPKVMGEKHFWQKKFLPQIVAMDRQTAVLTTPQRSFCRKARKKFAQVWMMSKKNLFEKKSLQQISLTSGNQFGQNCYLFSDRKNLLFFVQCSRRMKKHAEIFQSRCLSSKWSFGLFESSVVHLAEKNSNKDWSICDRCPKIMGKKFWRNFFHHKLANWQTESSTDNGSKNFCRNDIQMSLNAQWWKKQLFQKKIFTKSSWTRGRQLWQICRLFFDGKKPLILCSLSKNHWINKQKLCQNKVMSSKWSFGLEKSSVVNLAEKKFERRLIVFGWMSKRDAKKIFDKNFFTTNWSYWQTESSTDNWTDKFPSKWQKKFSRCPMQK